MDIVLINVTVYGYYSAKYEKGRGHMNAKWEELMATTKLNELLSSLNKKEEEKHCKTVLWALAIIGAVAAVAAIAYAVYYFVTPDYLEDFEDDFEDDFDDDFFREAVSYTHLTLQTILRV